MRYIGCKKRLLNFIYEVIKQNFIDGEIFCDLFSGTASVGNYFKQQGYRIISNDLLLCSYVQQQVKIGINAMPPFKRLAHHLKLKKSYVKKYAQAVIDYLNALSGIEGFIYHNYSFSGTKDKNFNRMYYTDDNAKKIDIIREQIEAWKQLSLINDQEFYVLLYALLDEASLRANTTGMQNGFLKHFYSNSLKPLVLKLPEITADNKTHQIYCENSLDLIHDLPIVDILYLDPPYTGKQYAAAYHLLETIARWDQPILFGKTGLRPLNSLKSTFCNKSSAFASLETVISKGNYRHLLLSYSSDGVISHEDILFLLEQYGSVTVHTQNLLRYNSMSINDYRYNPQQHVKERLYYLKPYSSMPIHRIKALQNKKELNFFTKI